MKTGIQRKKKKRDIRPEKERRIYSNKDLIEGIPKWKGRDIALFCQPHIHPIEVSCLKNKKIVNVLDKRCCFSFDFIDVW